MGWLFSMSATTMVCTAHEPKLQMRSLSLLQLYLFLLLKNLSWGIKCVKGAGTSDTPSQTKEELPANDTSRHPKVPKIGPNHGCQ